MSSHEAALVEINRMSRSMRLSSDPGEAMVAGLLDAMLKFLRDYDPVLFPCPETASEEALRLMFEWQDAGVADRTIQRRLKARGLK